MRGSPVCPRLKMAADRRHPTHMCVFEVDTVNGLDKDAESEFTEITWIGYTIVDFKERDVSATVCRTGRPLFSVTTQCGRRPPSSYFRRLQHAAKCCRRQTHIACHQWATGGGCVPHDVTQGLYGRGPVRLTAAGTTACACATCWGETCAV